MRTLLVAAAVLLAACQADEPAATAPEASPAAETQAPAPTAPAPTTLAGEWRIAGIDGEDFNEPYGLALSADDTLIWWEPRCAGLSRSYKIEGNRIRISSPPPSGPPPEPGDPPPPVCTIGLPPRLTEVFLALDGADRIETTPANGILISGGQHSLTLFSQ